VPVFTSVMTVFQGFWFKNPPAAKWAIELALPKPPDEPTDNATLIVCGVTPGEESRI